MNHLSFQDVASVDSMYRYLDTNSIQRLKVGRTVKLCVGCDILTRNELIYKFKECLENHGPKDNRNKVRTIFQKLSKLDAPLLTTDHPQISKWRQSVGNLWFKVTHSMFDRKEWLARMDEEYQFSSPSPDALTRNLAKAIQERKGKSYVQSLKEVNSQTITINPLKFKCEEAESIGKRKEMQDAHFYLEKNEEVLTGVFDGHGPKGDQVSKLVSALVKTRFQAIFKEMNGNVRGAFDSLANEVQNECVKNNFESGTTAVICYIKENKVYTATLGDSEANIYRINDKGELKSIPLSCIRDWKSPKDNLRGRKYMGGENAFWGRDSDNTPSFPSFFQMDDPKSMRVNGCNFARAFGNIAKPGQVSPIIQKFKITECSIMAEDTLILCCDGLKDIVADEAKIVKIVQSNDGSKNLAEELVKASVDKQTYDDNDNVTVIAIKISR